MILHIAREGETCWPYTFSNLKLHAVSLFEAA
jgi:hypothetical protein